MKKQLDIIVPTQWKDLDLHTYLRFLKEVKNYEDNIDAQTDLMIHHFCTLDFETIRGLSLESYNLIKEKLNQFENPEKLELQRFVKIGDVEYGFEPNLSKMSYGAYVDISQYEELAIDKNWGKIMNILYRPVEKKQGELYTIEPYTGKDDWEKWLGVGMDVHFGGLFFFINLYQDLLKGILNSSIVTEQQPNTNLTLLKSGRAILQSIHSQMETLKRWKR